MYNKTSPVLFPERRARFSIDTCEPQTLAIRNGKIKLTALTKGHYPGVPIPNHVLPGLNSIGFWDGVGAQDWGLNPHRNEGIEIHYLETGKMAFTAEDRQFDLHPGDFTVTKPWQLHKLGDPNIGPGRIHWLIIDVGAKWPEQAWRWPDWVSLTPEDLAELGRQLRNNKTPAWKSSPEMARAFQQIARNIVDWDKPHSVSRMIANLNQLLVSLLDVLVEQQSEENPDRTFSRQVVEQFLKDLETNHAKCLEIQTLEEMARQCGLGITAFAKYTRELVNVGPMKYLKQCRLNHAAQQLREQPGASITDICFSNGFNSSQYFATCFRQHFRMSPREFLFQGR
jgi:AraC family L-rhamnose operon regulatory protein RhaS